MLLSKLLMSQGRLRQPIVHTITTESQRGVVPRGARFVEIMCVGAGQSGRLERNGELTPKGNGAYGGYGGDGGGAIPRTKLRVVANTPYEAIVGQTDGQDSTITIAGQRLSTAGTRGGKGGAGGFVGAEPGYSGSLGEGDAGPGGGGGNWGSNARGGDAPTNPRTGASADRHSA